MSNYGHFLYGTTIKDAVGTGTGCPTSMMKFRSQSIWHLTL